VICKSEAINVQGEIWILPPSPYSNTSPVTRPGGEEQGNLLAILSKVTGILTRVSMMAFVNPNNHL
jgi:hypothetical protein